MVCLLLYRVYCRHETCGKLHFEELLEEVWTADWFDGYVEACTKETAKWVINDNNKVQNLLWMFQASIATNQNNEQYEY